MREAIPVQPKQSLRSNFLLLRLLCSNKRLQSIRYSRGSKLPVTNFLEKKKDNKPSIIILSLFPSLPSSSSRQYLDIPIHIILHHQESLRPEDIYALLVHQPSSSGIQNNEKKKTRRRRKEKNPYQIAAQLLPLPQGTC